MPQHVNFLVAGNCDPRTAYFSTIPMLGQGVRQLLPSSVTRTLNKRPEVYLSWEDPLPTPTVTQITPAPELGGVGADANCGVGESVPALAKCDVGINIPFGKHAVKTEVLDFTTIDRRTDQCGLAYAQFKNVIRSGAEGDNLAKLMLNLANTLGIPSNLLRPNMTEFQFMREFVLWKAVAHMQKRANSMTQNGNPGNPSTAAYKEHWGLRTLLNADAALYPCVTTSPKSAPLNIKMQINPNSPTGPLAITGNEIEFYDRLNRALRCFSYRYQGMGFSVSPMLVLPNGTSQEFIEAYIKGSVFMGTPTAVTPNVMNGGSDVRDRLRTAVESSAIQTMSFGPVRIMEDQTVNLAPGAVYDPDDNSGTANSVTAASGKGFGKIQVIPVNTVNGEPVLEEQYMGYKLNGANRDTFIYDAEALDDGNQWGRFRVLEQREGACTYWFIEYQKRLLNNYPFLTGWIGDVQFNLPDCTWPV